MKLNLGCGGMVADGWINVDYALGARLMKFPLFAVVNRRVRLFNMDWDRRVFIHDLRKTFPWDTESVDAIYTSHTLEHLSKEDGRKFLDECFRVLKPGGLIRIVVPDLKVIISAYNGETLHARCAPRRAKRGRAVRGRRGLAGAAASPSRRKAIVGERLARCAARPQGGRGAVQAEPDTASIAPCPEGARETGKSRRAY